MRKSFLISIILLVVQTSYCQDFDKNPFHHFDEKAIHRIGDYGKLWAVLTLFHPELAYNRINADSLFTDPIIELLNDPSAENFQNSVQKMISRLGDRYTTVVANTKNKTDTFQLANRPLLKWQKDSIALLHFDEQFAIQNSSDYSDNIGLVHLIDTLKNARGIVIDLRESVPVDDEISKYYKVGLINQLVSHLSEHSVTFPAFRTRIHYGHESQTFDMPFYYQGWVLQNSSLVSSKAPVINKPVCLLINRYNNIISEGVSAMQTDGVAKVIADGDLGNFEPTRTHEMELADHMKVSIRLSEVLYSNGEKSFVPDSSITHNEDLLLSVAIKLVKAGSTLKSPIQRTVQNVFVSNKVAGYYNLTYPPAPLRLLGLMRFWSAINYFCPNKDRITKNWDSVLYEYVPKFLNAKDSLDYALAAAKLIKEINDSHGFFSSPVNNDIIAKAPEVQLRYVENKTIIYKIFNDTLTKNMAIGDEVISIDDRLVKKCRDSIEQLISASTEAALQRDITERLLAGKSNSFVKVGYKHYGRFKAIKLARKLPWYYTQVPKKQIWRKIEDKLGYVDFGRLQVAQIDTMFQDLHDTKAIILDDRSYPQGTIWTLINYLTDKSLKVAKGTTIIADSPDPLSTIAQESTWEIFVSPKLRYKGKIIVLVNERTQSQAEYTCMILQAANKNVTIIGSQTAGADGDVTGILMPGGIETNFSGHGVHYLDGRPTQGIGIVPDIKIEPTINGIKAGRDEVLERAILFAKTAR
jgi:C-terminal processing protease CtpA/Prc